MSTEDEIGQDFDQFVRTALMAIGQSAQIGAQRQQTRTLLAQQQQAALDQAARAAEQARLRDERERTSVIHSRVQRAGYWREASPDSIANVAAYAAKVAPNSAKGEDALLIVQNQVKQRYGIQIDVDALRRFEPGAYDSPLARSIRAVGSTHTDITASLGRAVTKTSVEREQAPVQAVRAAVAGPDYWSAATSARVANVATYASEAAPFTPDAQAAHSVISGQVQARYGVDVGAVFALHSDPTSRRDALANALDDAMAARREDGLAEQAAAEADRLLDRAAGKEAEGDLTAAADEAAADDALSDAELHRETSARLRREADTVAGEQQPDGPDIQAQTLLAAAATAKQESAPGFPEAANPTLNKAVKDRKATAGRRPARRAQRDRSRGRGFSR